MDILIKILNWPFYDSYWGERLLDLGFVISNWFYNLSLKVLFWHTFPNEQLPFLVEWKYQLACVAIIGSILFFFRVVLCCLSQRFKSIPVLIISFAMVFNYSWIFMLWGRLISWGIRDLMTKLFFMRRFALREKSSKYLMLILWNAIVISAMLFLKDNLPLWSRGKYLFLHLFLGMQFWEVKNK